MQPQATTFVADTDPYPWPWNGDLAPTRTCLLIAGVQADHAAASVDSEQVLASISTLTQQLRSLGCAIVHVRHTAPAGGAGVRPRPLLPVAGSPGAAAVLAADPADLVIDAAGHDAFCGSDLELELRARGIRNIVAVGLAAEVAVSCSVRSANDRGFECLTLADATAPLDPDTGARELCSVTMSGGIFGAIGTVGALLAAFGPSAGPAASST